MVTTNNATGKTESARLDDEIYPARIVKHCPTCGDDLTKRIDDAVSERLSECFGEVEDRSEIEKYSMKESKSNAIYGGIVKATGILGLVNILTPPEYRTIANISAVLYILGSWALHDSRVHSINYVKWSINDIKDRVMAYPPDDES